jgi:c-di-GMP-related signal transduction protein
MININIIEIDKIKNFIIDDFQGIFFSTPEIIFSRYKNKNLKEKRVHYVANVCKIQKYDYSI